MSDDGEEVFGFPLPIPEQIVKQIAGLHDHQRMARQDALHSLLRAFQEMDIEHLHSIRHLLDVVGDEPNQAGFWEGIMTAVLAQREKVCVACGKDHDAEVTKLLEPVEPEGDA